MKRQALCLLLVLGFLAAARAAAQVAASATLRGHVAAPDGSPLADAAVSLANEAMGLRRSVKTDSAGFYEFAALPLTGRYTLAVDKAGFTRRENGPFELRAGETATIDVMLAAGAARGEVTVYGTAGGVKADSPQLGTRLDARRIEETPVLGRKLTNLPMLDSAVRPARGTGDLFLNNTLFVIDGGGRRQATYSIDGSTGDDAWGRQTIITNVPLSSVQELTVLTSGVSAEYGRTTGGVVNLVTKSGTNDWKADLLGVYRPAELQPVAPVTGSEVGDQLAQGSGVTSGPILRDRLFFLIAGEYSKQDRGSAVTSSLAPQVYEGHYEQGLFFFRADGRLDDRHQATLRFNFDQFTDTNPQDVVGGLVLPSAGRTFRRRAYSGQLAESAILSADTYNEARAAILVGSPITEFTPVTPSTQFVRPGVSTEGESRSARLFNHQYQFADTFSFTVQSHSFRAGGDVGYSTSGGYGTEFGSPFILGQFTFRVGIPPSTPTSALTIADATRYTQGFGTADYRVGETIWSLFVQDDWRLRKDLVLNLGVRYDRQTLTDSTTNFAPRLGFAWTPAGDARTVVRGGWGIYYSEVRANVESTFQLGGPEGLFTYSAAPGQPGFPTSLEPLPAYPPGAPLPARDITIRPGRRDYYDQFFDVSKLKGYPDEFQNPRTWQATLGLEREVLRGWFLLVDGIVQRTSRIERNVDLNAPAPFDRTAPGQTRSASAADATRPIIPVNNGYRRIIATTNVGENRYDALQVNLRRNFSGIAGFTVSYTWSHNRNNIEPDAPGGDPNDANQLGNEWGDSLLNQTHRGVVSGWYRLPASFVAGGVVTAATGRPYNITTGADNNGDAANTDRPWADGQLFGKNAGAGTSTFDLSLFIERDFALAGTAVVTLRAEGFNLTNHLNVYGRNGTYGNAANGVPLPTLGQPLGGVANVEPQRAFQFSARVRL